MLTNPPVPCDQLAGTFNQEKALVGASSVIVKTDGSFAALVICAAGAHLNPAVSVALACVGKFPARKLLWYIPAQYVGAWLGSAFVLMTYRDAIIEFYGGDDDRDWEMDTAGIFVTSPAKGISNVFAAIDQVIALNHLDWDQCHSRALCQL